MKRELIEERTPPVHFSQISLNQFLLNSFHYRLNRYVLFDFVDAQPTHWQLSMMEDVAMEDEVDAVLISETRTWCEENTRGGQLLQLQKVKYN